MLEKERKVINKKWMMLVLTFVLCIGTCMSVFALTKVREGEVGGLKYTFTGEYTNNRLYGTTKVNQLNNSPYSYIIVKFQKDLKDVSVNEGYGQDNAKKVSLTRYIGSSRTGWRVHHTAKRTSISGKTAVSAGGYTIY